jgi:hypothetical protein
MRRVVMVLAVGLAAATLVQSPASAKSKPKPPKVVVLTADQLGTAMLALTDMPTGWAGSPTTAGSDQASTTNGICNQSNAMARAQASGVVTSAMTRFAQDPNNGPIIDEVAYVFPSTKAAQQFVESSKQQIEACTAGWQSPNPNAPSITVQWTVAPMSFTKLGDNTYAFRETATNQVNGQNGATFTLDSVYIAKDNNVVSVSRSGAASLLGTASTDSGQLQQFSDKALSKLGVTLAAAKKAASATTTTMKAKSK